MANYTETMDTSFNYPHIDIYKRFKDGVQSAWRAYPHKGYAMYSPSADVIFDHITNQEETYYCRMVGMPLNYNFDKFDYIAVHETECGVTQIA